MTQVPTGPSSPSRGRAGPARFAPRLGRRLALAFALSVALTALILALSSYLLVTVAQREAAREAALAQSNFNIALARQLLPDDPSRADIGALADALATRGDFGILILHGDDAEPRGPGVTRRLIAASLAQAVEQGRLAYQDVDLAGRPALAVGGWLRPGGPYLYFFFPRTSEEATLARLRNVLTGTGLGLALLGSLVGLWLSRRILRPVSQASEAAARMAGGDLDVRLPAGPGEFGALSASFNTMARNLSAKIAALEAAQARERRFTGDVAHELRTPVAALVGEASILQSRVAQLPPDALPPDSRRAVELVVTDVDRLRRLIDDLLEISRIDAQAAEVAFEDFEVGDFLRRMHAGRGWPAEVELVLPEPLVVCTDRRRLERIVGNLVENALRHGRPPVVVEAHAARPRLRPPEISVSVTDFGAGIPPEHRRHVFDRFYKADPSRGATRGSGLGLSIAWENARLLGGALRVRSRGGEGARFVLRLPLRPLASAEGCQSEDPGAD